MKNIVINDDEMYDYFEELLQKEWEWLKPQKDAYLEHYGLTNYDVDSLLGAKSLFYQQMDAEKQICLLENMQRFLYRYVRIEGLEELLVNNYGTIENSIFLEHDEKGNPVHTREHANHQMKNAFLGSKLLLEFGYLEDMADNIYRAESMTTRYLTSQAYQILEEEEERCQDHTEKEACTPKKKENIIKKLKGLTYKIFMVSSMLHDIGYPLEFYLRAAQKLTDYPPYLNILSPTVKTEFAEIKAHLSGSQLFRQVKTEHIKEKYLRNNHGVLSAISLLMHFYGNGRIYVLNREQRCIVEMAAIAIYHHTDKLKNGFRPVYLQDPISYMVRLCDDLQEWERFKLLISDKHNYLQCAFCGRLIREKNREYTCKCGNAYTKVTQIRNRKVNYICLCDSLSLSKEKKGDKEIVYIRVNYDYMKQIEILLDDYTAVERRKDDLEKLQKLIQDQIMKPEMEISFFLSNNPIILIDKMIEDSGKTDDEIREWIAGQQEKRREHLEEFYADYNRKKMKNPFGREVETNFLRYEKEARKYVLDYYGAIYSLYQMLKTG